MGDTAMPSSRVRSLPDLLGPVTSADRAAVIPFSGKRITASTSMPAAMVGETWFTASRMVPEADRRHRNVVPGAEFGRPTSDRPN